MRFHWKDNTWLKGHCSTQGTLQASPNDADAGSAVKLCQSLLQPFLQGPKNNNTKQSLGRLHRMKIHLHFKQTVHSPAWSLVHHCSAARRRPEPGESRPAETLTSLCPNPSIQFAGLGTDFIWFLQRPKASSRWSRKRRKSGTKPRADSSS